jgi:thioesterase domain-containing protein
MPVPPGLSSRLDERGVSIPGDDMMWLYDLMRRRYAPAPLDSRGVLFKARQSHRVNPFAVDPRAGWKGLFTAGFKVVVVPGDHISMIRNEHHRAALGRHMQQMLP